MKLACIAQLVLELTKSLDAFTALQPETLGSAGNARSRTPHNVRLGQEVPAIDTSSRACFIDVDIKSSMASGEAQMP